MGGTDVRRMLSCMIALALLLSAALGAPIAARAEENEFYAETLLWQLVLQDQITSLQLYGEAAEIDWSSEGEGEYGFTYTLTVTDEVGTYSYELRFRGNEEGLLEEVALSSPFIGPDDWDNMDSNIYMLEMIRGMLVLSVGMDDSASVVDMDTQVFEIVFGAMIDLDMGDQYAVTDGKSSFALRRVQMPDQSERWLAQAFLVSPDDVFPVDGTVMNYTSEDCVAPLEISTPEIGAKYYYIVLSTINILGEDLKHERAIAIFMRGGKTVEVNVPLGMYFFNTASGDTWLGQDALFGADGNYTKSMEILTFSEEEDGYYSGHSISLHATIFGNMESTDVFYGSFPDAPEEE